MHLSLTYWVEAVIPIEIRLSSYRIKSYNKDINDIGLRMEFDMIEERRNEARIKMVAYKQATKCYYNSKVKAHKFLEGDLVLLKVVQNTKEHGAGALRYSWEGPYEVTEVLRSGAY